MSKRGNTMKDVLYPNITVKLAGDDGNAFYILGKVMKALRNAGIDKQEVDLFYKDATSGNYDHLLQTVMRWVTID